MKTRKGEPSRVFIWGEKEVFVFGEVNRTVGFLHTGLLLLSIL
jgi:hypothetical protein